jgi:dienelactone hydrolase
VSSKAGLEDIELRKTLLRLLGLAPHVPAVRHVTTVAVDEHVSYRLDTLDITAPGGTTIPALFVRPRDGAGPFPALLYLHAHGHRYTIGKSELVDGRPTLTSPYAADLAERGFAVLCLDMPTFGGRATETESAAAKRHLWRGSTLFGAMLRDAQIGLDVLSNRADIDPTRLGAFGISMGATQAFWLAALDDRIRSVAHALAFADLEWLVAHGAFDLHGLYMVVPGLVGHVSTGVIAGSIAPRPQFCAVGGTDPLTPPEAVEIAASEVTAAYHAAGASETWQLHHAAEIGHVETPSMRRLVLDHFSRTLV